MYRPLVDTEQVITPTGWSARSTAVLYVRKTIPLAPCWCGQRKSEVDELLRLSAEYLSCV